MFPKGSIFVDLLSMTRSSPISRTRWIRQVRKFLPGRAGWISSEAAPFPSPNQRHAHRRRERSWTWKAATPSSRRCSRQRLSCCAERYAARRGRETSREVRLLITYQHGWCSYRRTCARVKSTPADGADGLCLRRRKAHRCCRRQVMDP